MAISHSPVYEEVYRFLISSPTPEQIVGFHASDATQERVRELLSANKTRGLTPEEEAELDEFERVNHVVTIFKAYARQQLTDKP